jgi:hypothetical protein
MHKVNPHQMKATEFLHKFTFSKTQRGFNWRRFTLFTGMQIICLALFLKHINRCKRTLRFFLSRSRLLSLTCLLVLWPSLLVYLCIQGSKYKEDKNEAWKTYNTLLICNTVFLSLYQKSSNQNQYFCNILINMYGYLSAGM